jgi:hypothetical protein
MLSKLLDGLPVSFNKTRLVYQIARGVSRDAHLWENDHLDVLAGGFFDPDPDFADITGNIPHGGIDLG